MMTLNAGMITVCIMLIYKIIYERKNHDPQTIYKEITDNIITEYVDRKPYA